MDDPNIQTGLFGALTAVITSFGLVVVAIFNNRRERAGAITEGIAGTLRERIVLRDEQIADLREELRQKDAEITMLREALREAEK